MIALLWSALLGAAPVRPAVPDAGVPKSSENLQPVEITADHLQIRGKKHVAVWVGHAKAIRGTTHLSCERLIAYYTSEQQVTRAECIGNAVVTDGEKWAKGDRADFNNLTGVLEVTGSPEAGQGENHVLGSKVIFSVDKDVIEVENASAVVKKQESGKSKTPPQQTKKEKSPP
jgi:lipopolysaccharide export system protein LptA